MTIDYFFNHDRAMRKQLLEAGIISKRDFDAEMALIDEAENAHNASVTAHRDAVKLLNKLLRVIGETKAMFDKVVA